MKTRSNSRDWRAHQGADQAQLLLDATGEASRQATCEGAKAGQVLQLRIALRVLGPGHPMQVRLQVQVLLYAQVLV